jgi:hypothetical protein
MSTDSVITDKILNMYMYLTMGKPAYNMALESVYNRV